MNNVAAFTSKETIHEQACLWVSRIDRGLTDEEKIALQKWVSQTEQHKEQLFEMASLWDDLSVMHELSGLFPLQHKPASEDVNSTTNAPWHRHPIAVAASIVLFCTIAIGWLVPSQMQQIQTQSEIAAIQVEKTAVGEQKTISLADGSVLHLNTDSYVEIDFQEQQRNIRLLSGEVHFEVAHDKTRPFVVAAGRNSVTAVGTAFNVELISNDDLELLVTEGKVMVQDVNLPIPTDVLTKEVEEAHAIYMVSGEKARFSNDVAASVTTVSLDQVQRALSWQQGMLVFEGEPLVEVLAEVSRYTSVEFDIADENLKDIRVAGFFKVGDIDGLLHALNSNFNIDHIKRADNTILLSVDSI